MFNTFFIPVFKSFVKRLFLSYIYFISVYQYSSFNII